MDTAPRPPRRWFRISLRTLLILVTLCGVILGWQLRIVQERKSLRRWLEFRNATVLLAGEPYDLSSCLETIAPDAPLPWYRRALSDEPVFEIYLRSNAPSEAVSRIELCFPEAKVYCKKFGDSLTDEQYWAVKHKIVAMKAAQARQRQEFVAGLALPEADLQFFMRQLAPNNEQLCEFAPALADQIEDVSLQHLAGRGYTVEAAVSTLGSAEDWLRSAEELRQRFGILRKRPESAAQAIDLRSLSLELLRAISQVDPPAYETNTSREYYELSIEYELASCQDQPGTVPGLSAAERRWHAAALLGERLCEAAQVALDDGVITLGTLVRSWERRRDARLAAADLTNDDTARRAAWQKFAGAVRKRQEIVEPLFEMGQPGGEAEGVYLLRNCSATAESAIARLDGDEATQKAALSRAAENSRLLVEATKSAFNAETAEAHEFVDAICRSIEAHQILASVYPGIVDAQAWRQQQANELHDLTMRQVREYDGSIRTSYVACHYLLVQLSVPAPASP